MTKIKVEKVIVAPQQFVFDFISDFTNASQWVFGISKLDIVGEPKSGLGTVIDASIKLGPKTLHSVIELVDYQPPIAARTGHVSGFIFRSEWNFENIDDKSTRVIADLEYELPGGLAGRALGKVIEPFIAIAIHHSEATLSNRVEELYRDSLDV